jgi:hypothetical protein
MTVHAASGETVRQLSEFAVRRFAGHLTAALAFRNQHVDVPFVPPAVSRAAEARAYTRPLFGSTQALAVG